MSGYLNLIDQSGRIPLLWLFLSLLLTIVATRFVTRWIRGDRRA